MGIFSKREGEKNLVVLFDIGSSSVGGALLLFHKNGIPKIIYSTREEISFSEDLKFEQLLASTVKSLEEVAKNISKRGLGAPEKIFCVLSSPWHASQIRTINYNKTTPFTFNSQLADSLTEKETALFEAEHLEKYKGEKIRSIELKNMRTMLNGYPTSSPLGKKAKDVSMALFISLSPESILTKFEEAIGRHFHAHNIKFSSFAISTFTVIRDLFAQGEDFILIDIGGEVTDISMVKGEVLRESSSFPKGINFMARSLASSMGLSIAQAKSFFSLYKDGHAEGETLKRLKPAIKTIKNEWLQEFQKTLSELSHDISIPANIFVTVDRDFVEFFTTLVGEEQFSQYTLTESKFKIEYVGNEALAGNAIVSKGAMHDPNLIIEAIYTNRFLSLKK